MDAQVKKAMLTVLALSAARPDFCLREVTRPVAGVTTLCDFHFLRFNAIVKGETSQPEPFYRNRN